MVDFTIFFSSIFVKWDPLLRIFLTKMGPMSNDFCWKSNSFGRHIPVGLNMWVPPPGLTCNVSYYMLVLLKVTNNIVTTNCVNFYQLVSNCFYYCLSTCKRFCQHVTNFHLLMATFVNLCLITDQPVTSRVWYTVPLSTGEFTSTTTTTMRW